ncbi:type IVB secretion system protein IcmH/DotU [Proteus columbae]|uniref:type IVB secretion system protein IcmH/DotU n=1 Tax=Proteus columbae TaxID=1987580 RepID=UPI00288C3915|nr:type IVB secretion system protein IcmH/DotU [Proteus columbae]
MSDLSLIQELTEKKVNHKSYLLPLRGNNINPMIDVATPLLGMVIRMKSMSATPLSEKLFQQVVTDIQAIEQQLQTQGYEPGAIVSFRYVLCTFIDEAALELGWDQDNDWVKQSLLVHFHNESWGGEKVFVLIERLLGEPKRYLDLLEFIYLCLCLGYRGRYKVSNGYGDDFNKLLRQLQKQIQQFKGESQPVVLYKENGKKSHQYRLGQRFGVRYIAIGSLIFATIIYTVYASRLRHQTLNILEQLNTLLS